MNTFKDNWKRQLIELGVCVASNNRPYNVFSEKTNIFLTQSFISSV